MKLPDQKKVEPTGPVTEIKGPVIKEDKKNIEKAPLQAAQGDDDLMSQPQP